MEKIMARRLYKGSRALRRFFKYGDTREVENYAIYEIPGGEEFWLPLYHYEGMCEISNKWRVRRIVSQTPNKKGEFSLSPHPHYYSMHERNKKHGRAGYLTFRVQTGGAVDEIILNRAMLQSFFGKIPDGVNVTKQTDGERTFIYTSGGYGYLYSRVLDKRRQNVLRRGELRA